MRHVTRSLRPVIAMLVAVAVVFPAVSASAYTPPADQTGISLGRGRVPNDVSIAGVNLRGMTEPVAREAIRAASQVPTMPAVVAVASGTTFTYDARAAVVPNVDSMVNQAYAATTTPSFVITPSFVTSSAVVTSWSSAIARKIDRSAVDAKRTVKNRRLVVIPEVLGRKVNRTATTTALKAAIASRIASPTAVQAKVTVPVAVVKPAVMRSNLGKTIVVSQTEFKVILYKNTAIEKVYRCAVGMPAYPTPVGNFTIIAKVANPTWRNPGSDWGTNMPSVIPPGPTNPLGTRALYLNTPGIRIHGTSKTSSIGTRASHGCVRLANHDVEDLYPRVPVPTPCFIVR